jgi:hypothetical protein
MRRLQQTLGSTAFLHMSIHDAGMWALKCSATFLDDVSGNRNTEAIMLTANNRIGLDMHGNINTHL